MKKVKIVRFKNGNLESAEDLITEEYILHLKINPEVSFDVIITPELIKEFVYGNLYTEGFIRSKEEIKKYNEKIKDNLINVTVQIKDFSRRLDFLKKNYNIVWTECGSVPEIKRLTDQIKSIEGKIKINAQNVLNILDEIKDKIELFKQTGALHYAFLFDYNTKLKIYSYDIGRHNAVDKVVGSQLLVDQRLDDKMLYITGRISLDIILKCLRVKIPIIISRGAPLDSAVTIAQKYNICLIGFLRGKRFNIYSHPEVIVQ